MDRNQTVRRNEFVPLAKLKTYKLRNYNFRLILFILIICGLGIAIVGSAFVRHINKVCKDKTERITQSLCVFTKELLGE